MLHASVFQWQLIDSAGRLNPLPSPFLQSQSWCVEFIHISLCLLLFWLLCVMYCRCCRVLSLVLIDSKRKAHYPEWLVCSSLLFGLSVLERQMKKAAVSTDSSGFGW